VTLNREEAGALPPGEDLERLLPEIPEPEPEDGIELRRALPLQHSVKGQRQLRGGDLRAVRIKPEQRLLLLDTLKRSGLPMEEFGKLVGVSKHTLCAWNKRFLERGPEGLMDQPCRVHKGSSLPELTKRSP
jgi:hypothetical protein